MSNWLRRAAVPFLAGATIALATTTSVWAFTQEMLHPNGNGNGNYNFNYGPLDGKSDDGSNKSDPNSPGFHFNVEHGQQTSPFGFHGYGNDSSSNTGNYFHEPLGGGR